jgi:probable phosphoglycerate mutase
MTTLIIARHGEAEYEAIDADEEHGTLTSTGRRLSTALGQALAGRRVAHVWTSPLARAVQTSEIVAAQLGVGVTTRLGLREFGAGDLAGPTPDPDPFPGIIRSWRRGDLDVGIPGGETGREIADRFGAVLREVADAHPGDTVLVVSHGGTIGLGVPAIARMDAEQKGLDNCATVEVLADADAWVCSRWG